MHPRYDDITSRISEPPRWWFNGVPRYKHFEPDDLSVSPEQVALARVACQGCETEFLIGVEKKPSCQTDALAELYSGDLNVGDPPRHDHPDGSRCAGETMGAVQIEVIEAWERASAFPWGWFRRPDCEGAVLVPLGD
jgi:hypothetical protein